MPFVPRWYDASRDYPNMLCSSANEGTNGCIAYECYHGPDFRTYIWNGTYSGNLSLPSDTLYIKADASIYPC